MRYRKTREWMHRGIIGGPNDAWPGVVSRESVGAYRERMSDILTLKHSSRARPMTMSVIHSRINIRTPGSMLAAWRDRRRVC